MADNISDEEYRSDATDELHDVAGAGAGGEPKLHHDGDSFSMKAPEGPVGVDIGTSRIVEYHREGGKFKNHHQLNAFFSVPSSSLTKSMLDQNRMLYSEGSDGILVLGDGAASFANIANGEIGRPMATGIMNPAEKNGPVIMENILSAVVGKPKNLGERLCFSVPAQVRGGFMNVVFHEKMIKNYFVSMGYIARSADEGYLVALSGLGDDNFTGIGISCGAGLCNVCLCYLSVPIFSFSIPKAGDYIDVSVANAVGERVNRVRVVKEETLDLMSAPQGRVERAFHIYYEEIIMDLVLNIREAMEESDRLPKPDKPLPIVISGGTSMPQGFKDKFENFVCESEFPIKIADIRMIDDPLHAVARGAYIAACNDMESE